MLAGAPVATRGNLLLDGILGADIVWAGDVGADELAVAAEREAAQIREGGGVPFLVPFGGSDAVGARGYVSAGHELLDQLPGLAHVAVAVGSGGTMAGLTAVLGGARVLGVDTGATDNAAARVRRLFEQLRTARGRARRE